MTPRRLMRMTAFVLALAAGAALAAPAGAQTKPAAPAAPAANPAYDAAKAAADALGADAVTEIQKDLIWTGDLNTLASGEFGKRTYDAIRAFQKRNKGQDTGILLPAERKALDVQAAKALAAYGFKSVTAQGVTVSYPAKLAVKKSVGEHGPKFSSPTGNVTVDILRYPASEEAGDALFARLKTVRPGRTVTYSLNRPDFFVLSGTTDGKTFYMRFIKTPDDTRGFVLGWDPALSPVFDRVAIAMAGSLAPEGAPASNAPPAQAAAAPAKPAAPTKPAGPPVPALAGEAGKPKTGIGFLVSAKGDILTSAGLVAGCTQVAIEGGGSGAVLAGDPANGPALVRLSAPAKAPPVGWRATPLSAGEAVSLVGAGERSETTVAALDGPGGDTRRITLATAYPAGASGVFDETGALAAFAGTGEPAALKSLFLSAFLRANGVAPSGDPAGDPAAAVVHLTCTPS